VNFYEREIVPRFTNLALGGKEMARIRARVAQGLGGCVLELGFGSGLNVPHYPSAVKRVLAVDPALVGRKLAAKRVADSPIPVQYVGLEGEALTLDDESVDNALVTWSLCTIPRADRALAEIRRVLRPDGQLHFVEHGLSPDARVARTQDRMTPLQRRLCGGCHLNRPIQAMLIDAGFELKSLENYYLRGPKAWSYMYEGVAEKCSTLEP
jgi:ubiquinone/menaquinone biosynthesis C-methylase UbiE